MSAPQSPAIRFRLTEPQSRVFNSPARFRVLTAGRRFGKTHLAIILLLIYAVNKPKSLNWYIAPTYRQAEQIAWEKLKDLTPPKWIAKKDETDLSIKLVNGSIISLRGADKPDSLRGPGLDFAVLDECAFMRQEAWEKAIRPMLSDKGKNGKALIISTPDGYNWYYDLSSAALTRKGWEAFHFTTVQGGNVSAEEIADARLDLDDRTFRQEYEASFEALTGRVYYAYDRVENALPFDYATDTAHDLLVGMDFNVDPMTATMAHRIGGQIHFIGEILMSNGNTEEMARAIKFQYPGRRVIVYPDPTGNARKTSAPVGQTDFTILRQAGFTVCAPSHPYPVADKINTVNAGLKNAAGVRSIYIDTSACPNLAKAWDGLTYRTGTNDPDKSQGLDHITDAAAYLILWELPMKARFSGAVKTRAQ